MEKIPFVSVLSDAYSGTQNIWQRFKADLISLTVVVLCMYWAGYRIPATMESYSFTSYIEFFSLDHILTSEVARDLGTATILAFSLALFATLVQAGLRFSGNFLYRALLVLVPQQMHAGRRMHPNREVLAAIAGALPITARTPDNVTRVYYGLMVRKDIQEELEADGSVRYWSTHSYEASTVVQNALVAWALWWVPDWLFAKLPSSYVIGDSSTLFWSLLAFAFVAELLNRHIQVDRAAATNRATERAILNSKNWREDIESLIWNSELYEVAKKTEEDRFTRSQPSLVAYCGHCLRRWLSRRDESQIIRTAQEDHRKLMDKGWRFERKEEHENYERPDWVGRYLLWRYARFWNFTRDMPRKIRFIIFG